MGMTSAQETAHAPQQVAWDDIERSPEYRSLRAALQRFTRWATVVYLVAYFGFLIAAGELPGLMGTRIYKGFTVGYALMLGLFVLVWAVVGAYLRAADRDWDPRAERIAAAADGRSPDADWTVRR